MKDKQKNRLSNVFCLLITLEKNQIYSIFLNASCNHHWISHGKSHDLYIVCVYVYI